MKTDYGSFTMPFDLVILLSIRQRKSMARNVPFSMLGWYSFLGYATLSHAMVASVFIVCSFLGVVCLLASWLLVL